jgi:signal transduction histidine kinase
LADRTRIVRLLDNAAKFTPPGGHVAIELERSGEGDPMRYTRTIADSGPGAAPRARPSER